MKEDRPETMSTPPRSRRMAHALGDWLFDKAPCIWDISSPPPLEKGSAFEIACQRLGNNLGLDDIEKRFGLTGLTPICGDNAPLPLDHSALQ